MDFIFLSSSMLLSFFFFHIPFLSFPETNLGSAEKASVKDEGRLLTDCAYEALTLWACMFLKFLISQMQIYLYFIWGYWLLFL